MFSLPFCFIFISNLAPFALKSKQVEQSFSNVWKFQFFLVELCKINWNMENIGESIKKFLFFHWISKWVSGDVNSSVQTDFNTREGNKKEFLKFHWRKFCLTFLQKRICNIYGSNEIYSRSSMHIKAVSTTFSNAILLVFIRLALTEFVIDFFLIFLASMPITSIKLMVSSIMMMCQSEFCLCCSPTYQLCRCVCWWYRL